MIETVKFHMVCIFSNNARHLFLGLTLLFTTHVDTSLLPRKQSTWTEHKLILIRSISNFTHTPNIWCYTSYFTHSTIQWT